MKKLAVEFYQRKNVVTVAKELIGKILITNFDGVVTSGRIVETEAYNGIVDKASHAYKGRRTTRTEMMYLPGGHAYVYLCYGIHQMFNVVTGMEDIPHAVLIRALEPLHGIDTMLMRTGKSKLDFTLTKGPGNLTKALGISTAHTGYSLLKSNIAIADDGFVVKKNQISITPRIGIDYADEHAELLYRFLLKENKYVSRL